MLNLLAGCVFAAGLVLLVRFHGGALSHGMRRVLDPIRAAGPWAYFSAMALLPAVGVPATPFAIGAAPAFAAELGSGGALAAALAAITANLALTYALARWVLGRRVQEALRRAGFELPAMDRGDAVDAIVLVRVVPVMPFAVQSYLLGFARVPFGLYLGISCAVQWSTTAAFVILGAAALQGSAARTMAGISLLLALGAMAHYVRRHCGAARAGRREGLAAPSRAEGP